MNINAPKGHSHKIKPINKNETIKNSQKNITTKPSNMTSKITISPIKNHKLNTIPQSSPSTPLTNDNAVATRNTADSLSTTLNTSNANIPISYVDNNSTVLYYLPVTTALNNPINKNYSQHNKNDITFASIIANNKTPSRYEYDIFGSDYFPYC